MKTRRTKTEAAIFNDIVKTLKRVPKVHLETVRAMVQALAETAPAGGDSKARPRKKGSLVDSPFCGMWKNRDDIVNERTYACQLRSMLETGGDRLR